MDDIITLFALMGYTLLYLLICFWLFSALHRIAFPEQHRRWYLEELRKSRSRYKPRWYYQLQLEEAANYDARAHGVIEIVLFTVFMWLCAFGRQQIMDLLLTMLHLK